MYVVYMDFMCFFQCSPLQLIHQIWTSKIACSLASSILTCPALMNLCESIPRIAIEKLTQQADLLFVSTLFDRLMFQVVFSILNDIVLSCSSFVNSDCPKKGR